MCTMFKALAIFAAVLSCISAESAVELLPEAISGVPLAPAYPVAPGVITARSQQYFSRNYNALAAPVLAPLQAFAPVQPAVVPRAPFAVAPFASSAQYSQFTQFAPNGALQLAPVVASAPVVQSAPVLPAVAGAPVAARPVEPVQPVISDDAVEIEAARVRQFPVNARKQQREPVTIQKENTGAPQKLVQEKRPVVKSDRLVAAPVLAASAPLAVPAAPAVRSQFGVPYFL